MAIDGLVKSGFESKWGFAQEATFGTALADSTNYILVESPIPSVDFGITQVQDIRHRGQRYADKNDTYTTQKGGIRTISVTDWIVRRADLAELLYGVTQTVVENATTPYAKDFDIATATTQPNFAADAGWFSTIFIDNVLTGVDEKYTSCIVKSLTLSANTSEGDGRLRAAVEFITGMSSTNASTLSGTPAFNTQNYYEFNSPSKQQIAAADVVVKDWTYTITNNATRVGNTNTGNAQSYALTTYDITGSITVKWDTATDAHLSSWVNGTSEKLQLSVGTAGNAGYFDATFDAVEYTGHVRNFDDAMGQLVTLSWKAVGNAGTTGLCNFQVDDATDQTW